MAIEDIKNELEQRFAEPLDECYKRRIIFWNDEDGEFLEEIQDFSLSNAKVLILTGSNNFLAKKLLSCDDLESNYLVYHPFYVDPEEDWLLDIKLYSESYRADLVSRRMQEMHILNTPELRNEVKHYKEFFNAAKRRDLIKNFDDTIDSKQILYMSILSAICGVKERSPESIIQATMMAGEDLTNPIKRDLLKYSINDSFWSLVSNTTGYQGEKNVDDLTVHVLLSALSRTLSSDVLSGLENKYSDLHSGFCYDLVFNWIHSQDKGSFKHIADSVSEGLCLSERFQKFSIDDLVNTDILPILDEVIVSKVIAGILNQSLTKN